TLGTEGRPVYRYRVALFKGRQPGKDEALATLEGFVEAEVARLKALREALDPRAEAERLEAPARAPAEPPPAAALRLRYEAASTRAMHQALAELARLRKARIESQDDMDQEVATHAPVSNMPVDGSRNEPNAPPDDAPLWDVPRARTGVRSRNRARR
ncbi:MAG: hypothetical protein AB7I30_02660, partial [Isosphaeraceae bacterium]